MVSDPQADTEEAKRLYGIEFVDFDSICCMDAVILAVAHKEFSHLAIEDIDKLYGRGQKVLIDVKGLLDRKAYEAAGFNYWRL